MDTRRLDNTLLDNTFAALADPTRRAIVDMLASGEISVSELAKPFSMSLPAIHKHIGILEEAGLIASEKVGRVRTCRLKADSMQNAAKWLEHYSRFWDNKLDAFEDFLENKKRQKSKSETRIIKRGKTE